MALVNPNIALGIQPVQLADPLAQYGKIAALQQAGNQNALAQYQLGAAQRGEARDVARINALASAGTDETAVANALLKSGDIAGYSAFVKAAEDRRTQKLTQEKTRGDIAGQPTTLAQAQSTLLDNKLKQARSFLDTIDPAAPDAPQRYLAWHEANHRDPIVGAALAERGISADQARQSIMDAIQKGPQAFANLLNQSKLGTEKFMEMNKPVTSVGPTGIVQTPGLGGAATIVPGTQAAFQMTPAQIAQNQIAQQQLDVSQGQLSVAQQRAALERQRVGLEGQRVDLARQETERKTQGLEALPPKEIQKREAVYPQATAAIKGFETKSDAFVKDLIALRDDSGLEQITGAIYGRTPSVSRAGSRAQALYDKIVAKGGFQALQDLRDASKTGGALGNVSNTEGKQLIAAFAAIDRRQDAEDVKKAINQAIDDIEGSKIRMREAYDMTYGYKNAKSVAPNSGADIRSQADAILRGGK